MTSPVKKFHNITAVKDWIEARQPTVWKLVSEMGESGDNPHIHFLFSMDKGRIDNFKDPLMKAYYGKDLQAFEHMAGFKQRGYKAKTAVGEIQYLNLCVYINKTSPEYDYGNIDLDKETKGMLTYEEHTDLQTKHKTVNYTLDQLLLLATEEYYYVLPKNQQKVFDQDLKIQLDIPPPGKDEFKAVLRRLHAKGVNLMNLYKSMKPFYINWLAQLGNYDAMERFIDKIDEDLNVRY